MVPMGPMMDNQQQAHVAAAELRLVEHFGAPRHHIRKKAIFRTTFEDFTNEPWLLVGALQSRVKRWSTFSSCTVRSIREGTFRRYCDEPTHQEVVGGPRFWANSTGISSTMNSKLSFRSSIVRPMSSNNQTNVCYRQKTYFSIYYCSF